MGYIPHQLRGHNQGFAYEFEPALPLRFCPRACAHRRRLESAFGCSPHVEKTEPRLAQRSLSLADKGGRSFDQQEEMKMLSASLSFRNRPASSELRMKVMTREKIINSLKGKILWVTLTTFKPRATTIAFVGDVRVAIR
jgi:hypothetical protein